MPFIIQEMSSTPVRIGPTKPGELVKIADSPGYEGGMYGWKSGPKLEKEEHNYGFKFEEHDVGIVIATWQAEPGTPAYCANNWFLVFVCGKGLSWFPSGWILTIDSISYADYVARHGFHKVVPYDRRVESVLSDDDVS